MDFREGGTTLVCMRSEQGSELYNSWTYQSIEPMDRIEFVQSFANKEGQRVAPAELRAPSRDSGGSAALETSTMSAFG